MLKEGDTAKIIEMPERGAHLLGQVVRIAKHGGLGIDPDDVMVTTRDGSMLFVKRYQLALIGLDRQYL
jgi:hypothetical protein